MEFLFSAVMSLVGFAGCLLYLAGAEMVVSTKWKSKKDLHQAFGVRNR